MKAALAKTGLIVLAVETPSETITNPLPGTVLPGKASLDLFGTSEQMQKFTAIFGS